jgi:hypothetical protein
MWLWWGFLYNTPKRMHSLGYRTYNKPRIHVSVYFLLAYVNTPLSPHHIRTKLNFVLLKILYDLHDEAKASSWIPQHQNIYRLVYMIMDAAHHRLFGPPRIIDECELKKPRRFLNLEFDNKSHFRDTVPLHIPEVVSIRCRFSKTLKNF